MPFLLAINIFMKTFICATLIDITHTGVTKGDSPKRDQQRNWETLTQILNLRTQIMSITDPVCEDDFWIFEFESESNVWNNGNDPVGVLKTDSDGVPMLRELNNNADIESFLVTQGPKQNIWFSVEPINKVLEN